jgi:hypothetical protein
MTLPNFMIAGTARCGTTSLYYYLKQHPEIGFPDKKEPKFFSYDAQTFPHHGPGDHTVDQGMVHDIEEYKVLFQGLENLKCIGEASSDYFFFHNYTVKAIKDELGDIPIIISIRNPVERAYSAYNNLVRDGRESLDFIDALNAEEERISDNWDWMWAYKKGGLYTDALEHYKQEFSRVKVVLLDDLEESPHDVIKDIFKFLDVDLDVDINCETKYSHSGKAKNTIISILTSRNNKIAFAIRKSIMGIIPRSLLERVASKLFKKDDLPFEARVYLQKYFLNDIEKLEKLLDRNLDSWKKL